MSRFYNLEQAPFNGRELSKAIVTAITRQYNGAHFDAQDLSTMFQDSAGTTPVTAMEQPVGKWLDKSGNGNHATQSITASRPVISARKNWLLATDALFTQNVTTFAAQQTLSFTGTGSITLSGAATGTLTGTGTNNRVSLTFTPTTGTLTLTAAGDVRLGQLEYGPTATSYQRVNTSTDYDAKAHFPFVRFDGIDDYLNLPYMGLYANGSLSVIVSESRNKTGGVKYMLAEANTSGGQNYIPLRFTGTGVTSRIINDSGATVILTKEINSPADSVSKVISFVDNGVQMTIGENSITKNSQSYIRVNPVTLNTSTIGAIVRASVTEQMNANLYGLIITKSALSDADRRKCEVYLGRKAGVKL